MNLDDPQLYNNRELSWLEFNRRVLEEAQDPSVPLLERVKFLAIFSANLDEFFMVRVGGLQQKVQAGITRGSGGDQTSPHIVLEKIAAKVSELVADQYRCLNEDILPTLGTKGIVIRNTNDLSADERRQLRTVFREQIFPVLTPLAIDPGHPFPHLLNKSLNLAVSLKRPGDPDQLYAVVQVPGMLPRFVSLNANKSDPLPVADVKPLELDPNLSLPSLATSSTTHEFVRLEAIIAMHLAELFSGMELGESVIFRVTRDSEFEIDDEVEDLLRAIEDSVRKRRRGHASRLEIEANARPDLEQFLTASLDLESQDVTRVAGLLDLTGLFQIYSLPAFAELRDPPFTPAVPRDFLQSPNLWAAIRNRDILIHHPYESFKPVVDFIDAAADDDRVLAVKQTLYRTSSDSPIVRALQRAADRGKQVTAVIELKARLDEERNILWARELEKAGVHVVFGFIGLKTHCKTALVVRRDEDGALRRYVHLASGNYNPQTARLYTDLGLFTCKAEFAHDVTLLFNHLTGYAELPQYKKLIVAPSRLQQFMIERIEREAANQKAGKKAKIAAKINGLLEPAVVKALYRASQAGVPIELVCRGVCALRPGIPGLSETIRVTSVVDRFLEHSRIFYFENTDGEPEIYIGSADWMDRNLSRRVEVVFPVEQPDLKARMIDEILGLSLSDNVKARELLSDGSYKRVRPREGEAIVHSQKRFLELAVEQSNRPLTINTTGDTQSTLSQAVSSKPKLAPRSRRGTSK